MGTYDVFLSHANSDKSWVERLARRLREEGLNPFLDKWHLVPGEPWQEALEVALGGSRTCAVFLGRGQGPWQSMEMRAALARRARDQTFRVIPVLLPEAPDLEELPLFLEHFTVVDFRRGVNDEAYHRLICGIQGKAPDAGKRPEPHYPDDETKDLAQELKAAYRRRAELEARGEDTTELTETVLDLRRKIREGGQLKAGDFLLNGRFELLEQIGYGGFARVWRAYDEWNHTVAAIKVLHIQYSEDRTRRERIFRGARYMARLQHPGVVRVVEERCEEGGYHFFVMEYVGGGDLRRAVKEKRLPPGERLRILLKVGEALDFAHAHGVIHRDVKPDNVLLDPENRPKLTDFDLVRAVDTTAGTRTAAGLGSYFYAAPEAMTDAKEAAEPADVYGLGMTAIFTLHGADLPVQVIRNPSAVIASLEVNEHCQSVLKRAIAWEVEERWATIAEFCQALRDALVGESSIGSVEPEIGDAVKQMTLSWKDGFSLEHDACYVTRESRVEVRLSVIVTGRIVDVEHEKLRRFLTPRSTIFEEMEKVVGIETQQLLLEIDPDRFFMRFYSSEDEPPVRKMIEERLAAVLTERFVIEEISVISKPRETELTRRLENLMAKPHAVKVTSSPFQEAGRREEFVYTILFDVIGVDKTGWRVFQLKTFQSAEEQLEKIKKFVRQDAQAILDTIPIELHQSTDPGTLELLEKTLVDTTTKMVHAFGLAISIVSFHREASRGG